MPVSPPHPLFPAQLRVRRARQLIGTLRRQIQRWTDAQSPNLILTQTGPREFSASRDEPSPVELLFRVAITVGEVAYNCRAALDYLIYEMARGNNGGRTVKGTQFPMEDSEEMYWARWTGRHPTEPGKRVQRYLKKVPRRAAEMLVQTQPFAGCDWMELLRDISNPDKHRSVTFIRSKEDFRNPILDPDTSTISGRIAVRVVFEDDPDLDVTHALRIIHAQTAHLIESFIPAFVGPIHPV